VSASLNSTSLTESLLFIFQEHGMMEVQERSLDGAINLSTGGATSPAVMNGDGDDQGTSTPASPVCQGTF
jgi:hypothetical protein